MDDQLGALASSQYLTFDAAGERYAIAVMKLREILPFKGATKVPMAPGCILGLINLRGNAIPVLDLSVKFGAEAAPVTKRSCVVIVDSPGAGAGPGVMGILADSVSSVVELGPEELEEAPDFGTSAPSEYLDGLARVKEEFIPIINVERILSEDSLLAAAPTEGVRARSMLEAADLPSSEAESAATFGLRADAEDDSGSDVAAAHAAIPGDDATPEREEAQEVDTAAEVSAGTADDDAEAKPRGGPGSRKRRNRS